MGDDIVMAHLKVAELEEEIASAKALMHRQQEMFSHKIDTVRKELKDGQKVNELKVNEIINTLRD